MPAVPIDFDDKSGLNLFRSMWSLTEDVQKVRDIQCERDYQLFHAFRDSQYDEPGRFHVSIPKMYSIINSKMPTEMRALLGKYPYIPIDPEREEYKEQGELAEQLFNFYLKKGGFELAYATADIMKILYGTSYIELIPTLEKVPEKILVPQYVDTINGQVQVGQKFERRVVKRFRMNSNVLAPWEVRVDRNAVGFEKKQDCRGIIKIRVMSKREIIRRAEKGDYGKKFDVDRLRSDKGDVSIYDPDKNRGSEILSQMGYPPPNEDSDMGILYEFESPDRYIKIWNDHVQLDDGDNPFDESLGGHGLINLSRLVHNIDPHTGASSYGNGEGKINEPLCNILNDQVSMTFDNNNMMNQGKTYFAAGTVTPEQLVHQMGNKIPIKVKDGEDIRRYVFDDYGQPLSNDFYALQALIEGYIDTTSNSHPPSRGESAPGDQTLGEVGFLIEGDQAPIELNVKIHEWITLPDLTKKGLAHIEQFTRSDDTIEVLGEEKANILQYKNPNDLPGGYNMPFKGSDKVINAQIRQRNIVNLSKEVRNSPSTRQAELDRVLFESHDLGDVADKIIMEPEEVLQMQQQQALADGSQVLDQNKSNPKNTDIAQEAGRAASGV